MLSGMYEANRQSFTVTCSLLSLSTLSRESSLSLHIYHRQNIIIALPDLICILFGKNFCSAAVG